MLFFNKNTVAITLISLLAMANSVIAGAEHNTDEILAVYGSVQIENYSDDMDLVIKANHDGNGFMVDKPIIIPPHASYEVNYSLSYGTHQAISQDDLECFAQMDDKQQQKLYYILANNRLGFKFEVQHCDI